MRLALFILSFMLYACIAVAQQTGTSQSQPQDIEEFVEKTPVFPGDLNQYLTAQIRYPDTAARENIQGRVLLRFVVRNTGDVSDVTVVRSVHPLLDEEAVRVVSAMPRWQPAMRAGIPVNAYFTLPVWFRLKT